MYACNMNYDHPDVKGIIAAYALLAESGIRRNASNSKIFFYSKSVIIYLLVLLFAIGFIFIFIGPSPFRALIFLAIPLFYLTKHYGAEKLQMTLNIKKYETYKNEISQKFYRGALESAYPYMRKDEQTSFMRGLKEVGVDVKTPRDAYLFLVDEFRREWMQFL